MLSIITNRMVRWSLLPIIGGGMLAGCGDRSQSDEAVRKSERRAVPVEVASVLRKDLAVTKTYTGALKGSEQVDIVSRISERVVTIKTVLGASIAQNQTVIVLDKEGPSSQYPQAEANCLNAEKNLGRMKALYQQGAVSLQALDAAQTTYDVVKANFEAVRQNIELTSPIAGVVTAIKIEVGDMVTPGAVLATVAQVEKMKVIFNMNEGDVFDLAVGQTVLVNSETRNAAPIEGKISEFSKSADSQSRAFEVRALFPNTPDRWFKPGMFVKVKYTGKAVTNVLVIPNQAILSDGAASHVFTIHNGRSFQKTVVTGISDGLNTAIGDGLSDRDTVVTVGWNNLRDSSSVSVISIGN